MTTRHLVAPLPPHHHIGPSDLMHTVPGQHAHTL